MMKNRIEEKSDYETAVRDDPVILLKRIKQYMFIPTKAKYDFEGLWESMKRFVIDTKQEDHEGLNDYTKRFKQAKNIFKQSLGEHWLDHFMKQTSDYTNETEDAKKAQILKDGPEQLASFIFLRQSEPRKYGKLVSNLKEQYALGNDQYPKKLDKTVDALNNHKWDEAWNKHVKTQKES